MVALPQTISPTVIAIDMAVVAAARRDFDFVVRGSSIGHECERHLFYRFRWAHAPELLNGQKLRLFETGHREEARMVDWLRAAGIDIQDRDPETGEQWEVIALDGHFAGHLDGIATGIVEAPVTPHLCEFKTHNAKSFAGLKADGVAKSKPAHVAQMQVYMHLRGLTRAFYLAKHKDSDELYAERIHYDAAHALALMAKAERIRDANAAPARISDDPSYYLCQSFDCPSYGICHNNEFGRVPRNCRTCLHSSPVDGGRWWCARFDHALTIDDQRAGCPNHLFLPTFVPGEQVDADEQAETVTYRAGDLIWIDGEHRADQPHGGRP